MESPEKIWLAANAKRRHREPEPMSKRGRGERCHWCRRILEAKGSRGKLAATRDHVHPKSRGGAGCLTVWCCRVCNEMKGDMLEREWMRFMREHPEWWRNPAIGRKAQRERTRAKALSTAMNAPE